MDSESVLFQKRQNHYLPLKFPLTLKTSSYSASYTNLWAEALFLKR